MIKYGGKSGRNRFSKYYSNTLEKKISICIIIIIFTIIGLIYTLNFVTPKYQSHTTLVLAKDNKYITTIDQNGSITQTDITINEKLVTTYSELIKSDTVLEAVICKLNLNMSINSLKSSISVTSVSDTELIKIVVTNENSELAKNVANEVANIFITKVSEIYNISNVHIVDSANIATLPCNINHTKDVVTFSFVGIVISVAYVFVINIFDTTIKSSQELEKNTKTKVLAEIPIIELKTKGKRNKNKELIAFENPKSTQSEVIKKLRTRIQYMSVDNDFRSILITSTILGEGKSLIAANLAITFAQVGYKVVLIDADMRRSRQHKIFNLKQVPGVSNYLSGLDENNRKEAEVDISTYLQETMVENLRLFSCGTVPPNSSELLASKRLEDMINKLKEMCDIIIFDRAPSYVVTDSVIISRFVDSTIIIAEQNVARQDGIIKIKKEIEEVGGKVSGIVLNKVEISKSDYKNNYKYYDTQNLPIKLKK